MISTPNDKLFTISLAAKYLGISKSTMKRRVKSGAVKAVKDANGVHVITQQTLNVIRPKSGPEGASSQRPLTISQAAKLAGVSPSTLRRWESAGILSSNRTPGGERRYEAEHIANLLASRTTYQRVPLMTKTNISEDIKQPIINSNNSETIDNTQQSGSSNNPATEPTQTSHPTDQNDQGDKSK